MYKLIALETGYFALDGGAMFGVVPKTLWQKSNPADHSNRIPLALRTLLLVNSHRKILIDTGIGNKFDAKWQDIYRIDHTRYSLATSLARVSIDPGDITDVILSHLHFDHCGGTTYFADNRLQLTFPSATHHVQKEQWDWANTPSEKDQASFLPENYTLLIESDNLNLISGQSEIFPGIETIPMWGHTPAMQAIKINLPDRVVLFCSDLIPTASHIPLPWVMAYDNHPITTIKEKNELLPLAHKEEWLLFFEHDPFRAAGTITLGKRGYGLDAELQTDKFNQEFGTS